MKRTAALLLALPILSACTSVPKFAKEEVKVAKTSTELAEVGFYVEQPVLWAGIAERYQPNFNVTSASSLLGVVAPSVGDNFGSTISNQAFGLDVRYLGRQLDNTSSNNTSSETKEGTTTTTSSSENTTTSSRKTPELPGPSDSTFLKPSDIDYSLPKSPNAYDPSAQYRAAAALYQRIQNLDNYLRVSYDTKTHIAYLMRAKLTVSPRTKGQPFDLYSSISFDLAHETISSQVEAELITTETMQKAISEATKSAKGEAKEKAAAQLIKKAIESGSIEVSTKVIESKQIKLASGIEQQSLAAGSEPSYRIFPLLIADNIERINTSQIQNAINAVSLGLGLGSGSTSVNAAYENAIERLEALVGSQVNSLVTLSQTSRQNLVVKISAGFDPEHKYSMRERTYDVSFVVAMPRIILSDEDGVEASIKLDNEFTNIYTGKALPAIASSDLKNLVKQYKSNIIAKDEKTTSCVQIKNDDKKILDDLRNFIYQDDVSLACWLERDFYFKLRNIRDRVAFKSYTMTFPGVDTSPPDAQAVIYTDNGERLVTSLSISPNKDMSFADAFLKVSERDEDKKTCIDRFSNDPDSTEFLFPHKSLTLRGRTLDVVFPSLRALGCTLEDLSLDLTVSLDSEGADKRDDFVLILDKEASEIPPRATQFELARFTTGFNSGADDVNGANARLIIEPLGRRFPSDFNKFRLSVTGAILSKVTLVGGGAPTGYSFKPTGNLVEFNPSATVTAYDVVLKGKDAPETKITISVSALDSDGEELPSQLREETFSNKEDESSDAETE